MDSQTLAENILERNLRLRQADPNVKCDLGDGEEAIVLFKTTDAWRKHVERLTKDIKEMPMVLKKELEKEFLTTFKKMKQ